MRLRMVLEQLLYALSSQLFGGDLRNGKNATRATLDHSRENPPCDHDRARRRCVHHVQPRVRDDRDTPLLPGWMGEVIAMICPTEDGVYFFG